MINFKEQVNAAIDKLEKQGHFSKDSNGQCYYQNANSRCIIGHMIPNFRLRQKADDAGDSGICDLIDNKVIPEFTDQFNEKQQQVLGSLQQLHDIYGGTFEDSIRAMRGVSSVLQ